MSKYLFIESRDPFEHADTRDTWGLALDLAQQGHDVAMFLVQNGVLAARDGAQVDTLTDTGAVRVLADDVSLTERGIPTDGVRDGISVAGADTLVDLTMEDGRKPIWT